MKRSGFDNLITKMLKKWMSKRKHLMPSGIRRRLLCIGLINERRDRIKASVLVIGGHFER